MRNRLARLSARIARVHSGQILRSTTNGKLYHGTSGSAGDIGHYLLHSSAPSASSNTRVLDEVVSRTAIATAAARLASRKLAPHLLKSVGKDPANITAGGLGEAIANGDSHVERLVRRRCHILGAALSNLVDFLNPEMIVLGGGLADKIPAIVRAEVEAGVQRNAKRDPKRVL